MAVIAVDFDDTIFYDDYPFVGDPIPGAVETINKYYDQGHKIIIWTCREGESAEEAILAMEREGLKYHLFNNNDPERVCKYNNDSRKIGCDILIDDKALPFLAIGINWEDIDLILESYLDWENENKDNCDSWREWKWEDAHGKPLRERV
jgi:hydroxymethylpyrimidine pyrophosphatase-like HAD family hydrolase